MCNYIMKAFNGVFFFIIYLFKKITHTRTQDLKTNISYSHLKTINILNAIEYNIISFYTIN